MHVLFAGKGGAKIIITYVKASPTCTRGGDGAINGEFYSGEAGTLGGDGAGIVNKVTADGKAGVMCFDFLWS